MGNKRRERRRTERAGGAARFRTQVEDRQQGRQRRQAEQKGSYFRKEALGSDQHAYTALINKVASLFGLLVDRYFLKCFLQCSFRGFCPDTAVNLVNLLTSSWCNYCYFRWDYLEFVRPKASRVLENRSAPLHPHRPTSSPAASPL